MKVSLYPSRLNQHIFLFYGMMAVICSPLLSFSQAQEFVMPSQVADLPEGTTPELILEAYGTPMIKVTIPNSNEEVWSYSNKNIIMQNSVLKYIDRSLEHSFHEGSSRLEVILAQGFPDRIFFVDTLKQEIWHYQTAFIIMKDNTVIEWVDHDQVLHFTQPDNSGMNTLTIGQSKEQIVKMVGYPHSIQQFPALNESIWHYEGNFLTFKNDKLHSFDQQESEARDFRGIFKNDGDPETTESLLNISSNLGIVAATNAVMASRQTIPSVSGYRGVFKHDGNAATQERLNSLPLIGDQTSQKWNDLHTNELPQTKVKHFLGLHLTSDQRSVPPSNSIGAKPNIKAITNVQQVFGYNFFW